MLENSLICRELFLINHISYYSALAELNSYLLRNKLKTMRLDTCVSLICRTHRRSLLQIDAVSTITTDKNSKLVQIAMLGGERTRV